ncbi:hypothetical protein [Pollutibacter soli]|uniref:hypothetical protein n=1 Tax=Pollutibacter soli TaxID=3034157 RepID=UPI0030141BBA
MHSIRVSISFLVCCTWLVTAAQEKTFENFISRHEDQLMEGDRVFRFIGVNTPNINGHYDGYRNTNPDSKYAYDPIELSFEMENYFKDLDQMGVTVIRNWGIPVADGSDEYEAVVEGPGKYNETALRRIDKMLQLCNRYRIRVILCLVKENRIFGSTSSFAQLYGGGDYYKSKAVKDGYKQLLETMVNRKNTYTGELYKNDKAILAWEFGNEVPNSKVEWLIEMTNFLKTIDPNHLIADPRRANGPGQMDTLVNDVINKIPNIDIVKTRQYPNYRGSVAELWDQCKGKRPMIIDEFQRKENFENILKEIVETGTSGGLLWSLMKNQYRGGIGGHALFHSYSWGGSRWPGFKSGDYFNESENLMQIRAYSYKIRGLDTPPLPPPTDRPFLYQCEEKGIAALKWRCSSGSKFYHVERSSSPGGPWTIIADSIDISYDLYFYPMFSDTGAVAGQAYYYRVAGKNKSGISPSSNIVGPVISTHHMLMDNLSNLHFVFSKSDNLSVSAETYPRLRQTEEDYFQLVRLPGSPAGELIYKADQIKSISVFVFNDTIDQVSLQYSFDGKKWKSADKHVTKKLRPGYPSPISEMKDNSINKYTYTVDKFPKKTRYVRISTGNAGMMNSFPWIGRVHLVYQGRIN